MVTGRECQKKGVVTKREKNRAVGNAEMKTSSVHLYYNGILRPSICNGVLKYLLLFLFLFCIVLYCIVSLPFFLPYDGAVRKKEEKNEEGNEKEVCSKPKRMYCMDGMYY
jgi:hypothetical protein